MNPIDSGKILLMPATYFGPQLSLSALLLKVSDGVMFNAVDYRDRHAQLAIGCGF